MRKKIQSIYRYKTIEDYYTKDKKIKQTTIQGKRKDTL